MDGKLQSLSVLIVEDSEFQRRVALQVVSSLGVTRLYEASNGIEAMEQLHSAGTVDIVICDLQMQEMDGIQFIRQAAEQQRARSLIILSAMEPRLTQIVEDMARAQNLRVLGVLPKPISTDRIRSMMALFFLPENPVKKARTQHQLQLDRNILEQAIDKQEIVPYYQPKVLLSNGKLVSFEALARWQHPKYGLLNPSCFVPFMESAGLISKMTLLMLEQTILQISQWPQEWRKLYIGINISPTMLSDTALPDILIQRLDDRNISPSQLNLEITEDSPIKNSAEVLETLARLKMKGFSLSIDDFGTGYSNMQQLKRVPFSKLKIDQSFVHNAHKDATQRAIIEAKISLARSLNMQTVAEGIETLEDWNLLKDLEADIAQGFFVGHPMPADELEAWEARWQALQPVPEMPQALDH